jgi:photosystem II stability/assembly factor-like uncharacterized protein
MRFRPLIGVIAGCVIACALTAYGAVGGPAENHGVPYWLSLFGVAISGNGHCYIVGGKGHLFVSDDQGKTWSSRLMSEREGGPLFQDFDLYDVRFAPDGSNGWIVGEKGLIFHTTDGGGHWEQQNSGVKVDLFRIAAVDAEHVRVSGSDGTLLRSDDGGKTWSSQTIHHITYFSIAFTDADHGVAVGEFSTVMGTDDGGKTWQLRYGGNLGDFQANPYLSVAFAKSGQQGWALGLNGEILVTNDGGKTWQPQKLATDAAIYTAARDSAAGDLWLAGQDGEMMNLSPDGHLTIAPRVVFNDLTDMAFAGKLGLAVGLDGTILRTADGGKEWHLVR